MSLAEERTTGFTCQWGRKPRTDVSALVPVSLRRDPELVAAEREQQARAVKSSTFDWGSSERARNARQASAEAARKRMQETGPPAICTACGRTFHRQYLPKERRLSRAKTCGDDCARRPQNANLAKGRPS